MAPSGRWLRRLPWQEPAAPSMRRQPGRPCCTRLDAYLAPQVRPLARAAHGPGISLPGCGQDGLGPARGLGGTAAECEVRGLHADPRRLGLWHAEPFEDIQRLPEGDPRRVRLLRAERRFRDSLEDFALLVRLCLFINGSDVVEHVGLVWEFADATVDGQCLPVSSETFLIAAFVTVDTANILIQDRLVLCATYLSENLQ